MLHLPGWTAVHTSSRRNSACCVRIEPSLCICDDQAGMQLVSNIAPRITTARSCGGQRRSRLPHIRRGVVVAHSAYRLPSSADRALLQPSEVLREPPPSAPHPPTRSPPDRAAPSSLGCRRCRYSLPRHTYSLPSSSPPSQTVSAPPPSAPPHPRHAFVAGSYRSTEPRMPSLSLYPPKQHRPCRRNTLIFFLSKNIF